MATIASAIGTALGATQGSCRPSTLILEFPPFWVMVSCALLIDDVGVREKIGCASHKRISSQYSWQHYLERAVKIYDLE